MSSICSRRFGLASALSHFDMRCAAPIRASARTLEDMLRRLDIEVDVYLDDGRTVFGVLEQWDQREGGWWGWVLVHESGTTGRRQWVPADRLAELVYCPWRAGVAECLHGCDRPGRLTTVGEHG